MTSAATRVLDPSSALPRISAKEFALFRDLIHRESGIFLSEAKKALVVGRLGRRLRELGLSSLSAYYRLLAEGDEEERVRMLDCICTNETHFFREPRQFEFLEKQVFPEWGKWIRSDFQSGRKVTLEPDLPDQLTAAILQNSGNMILIRIPGQKKPIFPGAREPRL